MISLVSTWPLKNGCSEKLAAALRRLAGKVEQAEPDTWMYLVHLGAKKPLDSQNQVVATDPIPLSQQQAVIFTEIYRNEDAFARHITGQVFLDFVNDFKDEFITDAPNRESCRENTGFLLRQSGFIRPPAMTASEAE